MICTDVKAVLSTDDGDKSWTLEFTGTGSDNSTFWFEASDPTTCSLDEWFLLAETNHHLQIYSGNGEGAIVSSDDWFTFTATPSGDGGDVTLTLNILASSVRTRLHAAIVQVKDWMK